MFALSRNKLYVDEVYDAALVKPAEVLAFLAPRVRRVPRRARAAGRARSRGSSAQWVRPIQNGLVQFYALAMVLGLAVFLSFVVFRVTR